MLSLPGTLRFLEVGDQNTIRPIRPETVFGRVHHDSDRFLQPSPQVGKLRLLAIDFEVEGSDKTMTWLETQRKKLLSRNLSGSISDELFEEQ